MMMTEDIWTMARCANDARSVGGGWVAGSVVTGDGLGGMAEKRSGLCEPNLVPDESVAKNMGSPNRGTVPRFRSEHPIRRRDSILKAENTRSGGQDFSKWLLR